MFRAAAHKQRYLRIFLAVAVHSVAGLTRRSDPSKDVHVQWKSISRLRVGDEIQVKILDVKKADPAKSRQKAN